MSARWAVVKEVLFTTCVVIRRGMSRKSIKGVVREVAVAGVPRGVGAGGVGARLRLLATTAARPCHSGPVRGRRRNGVPYSPSGSGCPKGGTSSRTSSLLSTTSSLPYISRFGGLPGAGGSALLRSSRCQAQSSTSRWSSTSSNPRTSVISCSRMLCSRSLGRAPLSMTTPLRQVTCSSSILDASVVAHLVINDVSQFFVAQEAEVRRHAPGSREVFLLNFLGVVVSGRLDVRVDVLFGGGQIGGLQLVGARRAQACRRHRPEAGAGQLLPAVRTPPVGPIFDALEGGVEFAHRFGLADV